MTTTTQPLTYRRFYLAGEPIEMWEDPDLPFRCTPDDFNAWATNGDWVLLFNALAMMGGPLAAE
jgi:hypothetical protein